MVVHKVTLSVRLLEICLSKRLRGERGCDAILFEGVARLIATEFAFIILSSAHHPFAHSCAQIEHGLQDLLKFVPKTTEVNTMCPCSVSPIRASTFKVIICSLPRRLFSRTAENDGTRREWCSERGQQTQ